MPLTRNGKWCAPKSTKPPLIAEYEQAAQDVDIGRVIYDMRVQVRQSA
jgi:hypothetical protein